MSDDYFDNDNDEEYWDDVYYEQHRDEYNHNSKPRGIGKILLSIFLMIWGIATMVESPFVGIAIIAGAIIYLL